MTGLGHRWNKLCALAGLDDMRIHNCRHTFANHAVMSGLDLYTVVRLLGYANTGSIKSYAHLAEVQRINKGVDHTYGIIRANLIFKTFWKPSHVATRELISIGCPLSCRSPPHSRSDS